MSDLKRILIVEDSPTVIEMMKMMLRDMNVKVQSAGSEFGMFQAIESFGKIVDLVIMDITLKSENGLDLIEKIRQNPRYENLPVIVVTEHAKTDFILRAKTLGVKSFIRKPIEKQVFIDRLVETIGIEPLSSISPAGKVTEDQVPPTDEDASNEVSPLASNSEQQSPAPADQAPTLDPEKA